MKKEREIRKSFYHRVNHILSIREKMSTKMITPEEGEEEFINCEECWD